MVSHHERYLTYRPQCWRPGVNFLARSGDRREQKISSLGTLRVGFAIWRPARARSWETGESNNLKSSANIFCHLPLPYNYPHGIRITRTLSAYGGSTRSYPPARGGHQEGLPQPGAAGRDGHGQDFHRR